MAMPMTRAFQLVYCRHMAYNPELDKKAHGMPRMRSQKQETSCFPNLLEILILIFLIGMGLMWLATH